MKRIKKTLVLATSMVALIACGNGGSLNQSSADEGYAEINVRDGKKSLLAAFEKSCLHDAIALNGRIKAEGSLECPTYSYRDFYSSNPGYYSGYSYRSYEVNSFKGELKADYEIAASVDGLQAIDVNQLHSSANLKGSHDFKLTSDMGVNIHSELTTDSSVYLTNNLVFFNFDTGLANFLAEYFRYHYGTSKIYFPASIPSKACPLLSYSNVQVATQFISKGLDYIELYAPGAVTYGQKDNNYKAELALDVDTIVSFFTLASNGTYTPNFGKKADLRKASLAIRYTTEGITDISLDIVGTLDCLMGNLMPLNNYRYYPEDFVLSPVVADINLGISFAFTYDQRVTLPSNLGEYAPVDPRTMFG